MLPKISFSILFMILICSVSMAATTSESLAEAEHLMHEGQYEQAEMIFNSVLSRDPENHTAMKGKDDCRIMLIPVVPEQHILVPANDPGYREISKKYDGAKTPWDKRRAELAIERYSLRYTGDMFSKSGRDALKKADGIVSRAVKRAGAGIPSKKAYLEAKKELKDLQEREDRAWKHHGTEILKSSLEKLDRLYKKYGYKRP